MIAVVQTSYSLHSPGFIRTGAYLIVKEQSWASSSMSPQLKPQKTFNQHVGDVTKPSSITKET